MKVRVLLGAIEEAEAAGDLQGDSPVFVITRNTSVALDSPEAWHAVSIVDLGVVSEDKSIHLTVDASEDATDISVAALRTSLAELDEGGSEYEVSVPAASASKATAVGETYCDEQGLGLMLWFEGYEAWLSSGG